MIHKGEVSSRERTLLKLRRLNLNSEIPTHSIKECLLPFSMEPKDFGVVLSESTSLDGNPLFIINGPRKEIFKIEVLSGGLVNRGEIIGGRGSSALFSWEDTKQENGFVRSDGGNQSWHFYDEGFITFKTIPCKPFEFFEKDSKIEPNIIC